MALTETAGRVRLFEGLSSEEVGQVLSACRRARYAPGDILVRQGQPADSAFILEDGEVEIVTALPGGGELLVARLGPGSVIGEMALLDAGVRSATAVARAVTAGCFIERDAFRMLLAQRCDAAFKMHDAIMRTLCVRLRELNATVIAGGVFAQAATLPVAAAADGARSTAGFDYRKFLAVLPMFRHFRGEELDRFVRAGEVYDAPRGTVLFTEGDAGGAVYAVIRGAVEVTKAERDARRRIGMLGPGRLCGILAAIEGVPHSMTAAARELTTLLELKPAAFTAFYEGRDPMAARFRDAVTRELLQALARTNNHLARLISQARIRSRRETAAAARADNLQRALGEQDCMTTTAA
ncbi:MAG: cyclic nucleotide-binding domain-containing protein [Burkholderiales bacterium]|nr:cyclic nucleotide-binding domain-containing protein [Burkholderiales bacterium]